ncbi:MAG: tetratricopeptide repeat protein, partial [Cyanobacteria bacterium J06588_4]
VEPQNVSAYKNRASIYYYHLDEGDRAIADLTEAINLATKEKSESRKRSPNLPDYKYYFVHLLYKFRANVFLELEQFDRAIDDANQLITLRPEAVSYHFRAGIYQEAKQYENAIADENQAIAMLPNYAHAHRRRAEIYGELKQYEQAIADYTKAISFYADYLDFGSNSADYANAYLGRADTYRQLKQYEQAIADYDNSLAVYPEYAYAYKNRGELYQELGNTSQAKQDLAQAANLFEEQENTEEYQMVKQQLQQL